MIVQCYDCGYSVNYAAAIEQNQKRPDHGDWSVCTNCGCIGVFVGNPVGRVRKATPHELNVLLASSPETYGALLTRRTCIIKLRRPS